ncbi:hypothetical protein QTP88_011514 [Uroleucon formosanum]
MDFEFFYSSSSSSSSSSDDDFFLDSDDEAYLEDRKRPKNENYFETVARYNDLEFMEHFRVRHHIAYDLAVHFEGSQEFNETTGGHGKITAYNQVLIFLWFAGHLTASFRDVADRFCITISSLFRIVRRLTHVISYMASTVITWQNEHEKQRTRDFFQIKGFSNVIGAIDGSHIHIDKPSSDPDSYYNRKKFFSIHMQAVCDHKNKIRSVFIGFPGSVHDARVFRRSPLAANLETLWSRRQINFNRTLSSYWYVIEHCFGLLKQKFRQLYHCKLRKIEHIAHFIRACCVLHNLAIDDE